MQEPSTPFVVEPELQLTIWHELVHRLELYVEYCSRTNRLIDEATQASCFLMRLDRNALPSAENEQKALDFIAALKPDDKLVTVNSLEATLGANKPQTKKYIDQKYYSAFTYLTLALLVYAVTKYLQTPSDFLSIPDMLLMLLKPILFSTFGAYLYMLRVLGKRIKAFTYSPERNSEHKHRLALGILAGGCIFIFEDYISQTSLSPVLLAFLFGYAVDIFFDFLDSLAQTLREKVRGIFSSKPPA